MSEMLRLRNVTKTWTAGAVETVALQGVDLTVRAGEFVAVTGRSGSGKSTLLHVAAGLARPDDGEVAVAGERLDHTDPSALAAVRRRHVGVVFQAYNLLPSLTALENVALPLELDGTSSRQAMVAAAEALGSVGLGERGGSFMDQLSGGEQQRVAIARAVVGGRGLLLADEPTGAVDDRTTEELLDLLRTQADIGVAVVMVTHDSAATAVADRVVTLRDGRVAADHELGAREVSS